MVRWASERDFIDSYSVLMAGATEETNNASSMYSSYVLAEG